MSATFSNLRLWDGVAQDYLTDVSIRIDNGRIASLTARDAKETDDTGGADEGRTARDAGGLTVVPGLIDAHVHLCLDPEIRNPAEQSRGSRESELLGMQARALSMVRGGITTARDLGGGKWLELELRDQIAAGTSAGPRLLCAGQPVTSPRGHCHFWGGEAEDLPAALEVIDRQVRRGTDLIKVMATGGNLTPGSSPKDAQFDLETLSAIVAASTSAGRHVAAHCHGTAGIAHACDAGVRTIEHCSWVGDDGWARNFDPAVAQRIGQRGVYVSPTVNSGWRRRIGADGDYEACVQENFRRLREAGGKLIASTDAGIPGVFHDRLADALSVFAHFSGMTPRETLMSATSVSALALGLEEVTGRLIPGLSADLLFVEGDPLNDLEVLTRPVAVLACGQAVDGLPGTELVG